MKLTNPIFRLKRHARLLARQRTIPLSLALDKVAAAEGFRSWSHLAAVWRKRRPAQVLLDHLKPGDLMVLAARPGQGKTVLGLEILSEAARSGRPAVFFSSELAEEAIRQHLSVNGCDLSAAPVTTGISLADSVSARHVMSELADAAQETLAVIDYLQVMDQNRREPPIGKQIADLRQFAGDRQMSFVFLSQVHRSFDPKRKSVPDYGDLRMPNPLDLSLFTKGCFLHGGELKFRSQRAT